tara:strand:+ start:795 stop:1307 length:513 start_codon:yes stop_codon:yes gene_type:complete
MAVKSLIQTVTVGSGGAASIEFTGIDQTGQDLQVLISLRGSDSTNIYPVIQFNSDTSSANYAFIRLEGNGSSAASYANSSFSGIRMVASASGQTANTFGSGQAYVSNYTDTANKSISIDAVNENNATAAATIMFAAIYKSSSGISSIQIKTATGTFVQYSTASLYKIKYD